MLLQARRRSRLRCHDRCPTGGRLRLLAGDYHRALDPVARPYVQALSHQMGSQSPNTDQRSGARQPWDCSSILLCDEVLLLTPECIGCAHGACRAAHLHIPHVARSLPLRTLMPPQRHSLRATAGYLRRQTRLHDPPRLPSLHHPDPLTPRWPAHPLSLESALELSSHGPR